MKPLWATIQMKAVEQKFRVVLFTVLCYKMIPIFNTMDDTRVRHQLNESYWAVPSYGTVYSAMQGRCRWKRAVKDGSNVFFCVDMKRWKLNRQFCASYD